MTRIAFYSGSFDPLTNGHLDVVLRASALCDRLVIGVGTNPNKAGLFTVEERLALIREAAEPDLIKAGCALDVIAFSGLAIAAAKAAGAKIIVRGLRDSTDFDYEMQMAGMNGAMAPELRTVFLVAGASDHGDAGAPDRRDGRRCRALRAAECGGGAEGEIRPLRRAGAAAGSRAAQPPRDGKTGGPERALRRAAPGDGTARANRRACEIRSVPLGQGPNPSE